MPLSSAPVALEDLVQIKPLKKGKVKYLKTSLIFGQQVEDEQDISMPEKGDTKDDTTPDPTRFGDIRNVGGMVVEHNIQDASMLHFEDEYGEFPNFPEVQPSTLFEYPMVSKTAVLLRDDTSKTMPTGCQ